MTDSPQIIARLNRVQRSFFLLGLACFIACVAGAFSGHSHQFFLAYLFSWLFWLSIALGCMVIVMIHQLTGGDWGMVLRRMGVSAALTLPALLLLFIPIAVGIPDLYVWAQPDLVAHSAALQHKAIYLNTPFFLARTLFYFLLWMTFALILDRRSRPPRSGKPLNVAFLQGFSAAGLLIYEFTMSLASVDWLMSRDINWFSTIYGFMVTVGQALSGMAFMLIFLAILINQTPLREKTGPNILNDLGNLLMTMVVLWSYLAFAQLLVIWMGNIRQEDSWYTQRGMGAPFEGPGRVWTAIGLGLIVFHFFVPFLLLLQRAVKRRLAFLVAVAALLLAMRLVDSYWLVAPAGPYNGPSWDLNWMDFLMPVGIGGLWLALFIFILRRRPVIPAPAIGAGHD